MCLVDAYTWLGLESGNEYGIKPSIYSSLEVLKSGNMANGKVNSFLKRKEE